MPTFAALSTGWKRLLAIVAFCVFCVMLPIAFTRPYLVTEAMTPELQQHSITPDHLGTEGHHNNSVGILELRGEMATNSPTLTLKHRDLLNDYLPDELQKRGLLGPGGIMPGKVLPSILSALNPNVVGALTSLAAAPLSTLIPDVPDIPNILPTVAVDGGAGLPLVPDLGGIALNPSELATVADDASDWMAAGISGLLSGATKLLPGNLPLATVVSEVVAHATAAADQVLNQVQNAAAQVADLAAKVETDVLSPDGALVGAGSLLDNLESTIDNIVNGVVADVADVVPNDLLDEVKSLVTGGLNSILDATNGPVAAVASIIDMNLCEAVKLVEGLLVTVTGVCGDMASVTSFSPTYTETPAAAVNGASPLNPTVTGGGGGGGGIVSASAAQSATMPLSTHAGTLTIWPSATGAQGSVPGGVNPTQPGPPGGATQPNPTSKPNGAGSNPSAPAGGNGISQSAPGSGSGFGGTGQPGPNGASSNGGNQPSAGSGSGSGSSNPGNGQPGSNGGNGISQTTLAGSNMGTPKVTPTATGQPIPLSPEGTGPNGSWTGGGNMPSPTGQPIGSPGTVLSIAPGSGGGLSGVTVSVTITSTLTIANGAGQTQTVYVYVLETLGESLADESWAAANIDSSSGYTTTLTATTSVYIPCPAQPPCPTTPPTGSSPSGQAGTGPCPGRGYTCDDCIDGWFCPPAQTPAQSGPNGCFGWPCAHCSSGWFCIAQQDVGTCTKPTASGPLPNPGGPISPAPLGPASFTVIPPLPVGQPPFNTVPPQPAGALPTIKDPANGWSYSGCWADQPLFAVLDFTPETSFGAVENEKCVRHCISNGYTIAATSFGNKCFCGQYLNGTRKLDDSACMSPCIGDSSQACGGDWSLLTYTPNGIPRGWAPVGEQPDPSPRPVPTIVELVFGGVEQSVTTADFVVGPTSGMDMASIIDSYGERYAQSQASLPDGVGPATQCSSTPGGPTGASLTAPGSGNGPTSQSVDTSPTQPGDGSNTSSSPRGGGGVAPGQQTPTSPGSISAPNVPGQQTPTSPGGGVTTPTITGGQNPSIPISGSPSPTVPGGGNPNTTPGGIGPSSSGYSGSSTNTNPGGGTNPSTPASGNPSPSASSPNGAGGVAPGQQSPTFPGGMGPSSIPTASSTPGMTPGGGNPPNTSPISPNNGGGIAPGQQTGQQTPTSPGGIGPSPNSPGGSIPNTPPTNSPGGNGPGGQGLSTPPGNNGGTPTTPGGGGGNLPTCTPGSSGINCIPPLPPGVGLPPTPAAGSSFPPTGGPLGPTPTQPGARSQGTISLPGVATPTNPNTSSTQSNPRGASMTAPGRQSPSTSSTIPASSGTDNGSGSVTPGGGNLTTGPGGSVPGGPSSPMPTGNPTGPGGNVPGITPTPTTGLNGGITPGQSQTPTNPINGGGPSSYSWPPGMVPYGDHPPFTTLAHMLSWKAPDGSAGAATLKAREVSGEEEANGVKIDMTSEQSATLGKGIHKKRIRWRDSL
ncbi:hypothetical protein PFICI_06826 [Pestalotiopsis fici W106-1]|uniref:WSC domain-containing protein n=1 Tax=Pestalotiopsis fici (strain W106-1 / CGMCC3.15140) TaxID=1229662 RepID=W3X726_PESFW|nr:uncharacterized protein PFICI_06826 [Pestalotiopsis fici W106-1]ETS81824.1 hypothetical protein PFICI_06826 [Pestalotiopsis fici W106-1]